MTYEAHKGNGADLAPLYLKMAAVMGHLERLPKRGRNQHFKYDYVTDSDVLDAVRKAMAKEKVAFFVSVLGVSVENKKTTVELGLTFADGESGANTTIPWTGEAFDAQDKGINKAVTAGVKYALLKTFLVSTGEDDDPDGAVPKKTSGKRPKAAPTTKRPADKPNAPPTAELAEARREAESIDPLTPTDNRPDTPPTAKRSWPGAVITAIVDANLAAPARNAVHMLNLSTVLRTTDELEFILTWANHYRGARESGKEPEAAAKWADAQMPEGEPT